MSKKFSFISDIEKSAENPKVKYQVFEVQMGFEKTEVLVPFESADAFLEEAMDKKPKSVASMKKLAAKFGGTVE